jgi:hypothetical protein
MRQRHRMSSSCRIRQLPSKTDELVDVWFAKHFHGLGSMLDERLYNHVYAAKDDLKAELRKL